MGDLPTQTVVVTESLLTDHDCDLAKVLMSILEACGCTPKAMIRLYEYSAGRIPLKSRVSIHLPPGIGHGYLLPYGIARSSAVALEVAMLEAIVTVRDVMSHKLRDTTYVAIPRGIEGDIGKKDYASYVKNNPDQVVDYLNNCERFLDMFFSLHSNLVYEVEHLIDEFTDDDAVRERRVMMHHEYLRQEGEQSGDSSERLQ